MAIVNGRIFLILIIVRFCEAKKVNYQRIFVNLLSTKKQGNLTSHHAAWAQIKAKKNLAPNIPDFKITAKL